MQEINMKKLLFILINLLLVYNVYAANLETISPTPTGDWNYGGATVEIPNSTTLPATCTVGQKYQDTDASSGLQSYACEEPGDSWVLQGDGGSVGDNDITEPKLKAVDSPVDEECLTYEATIGDFEWQSCGGTYTAGGDLLDLTGTVFQINEGVLVDEQICNFEQTGSQIECNLNTDGSGDCMSGAVCLGDHTHSTYWDEDSDISADEIGEGKVAFSTACAAGNHYYLNGNDLACEANTTDTSANTECSGNTTYMDGEGNCDDISSVYEPVLTDKASLESTISDVTDFAEADGDVYTGVHDFGGATSTEIVNGATPTVDAAGEIAVDTTGDQLIYYGGAKRVITYKHSMRLTIESPADADNILISPLDDAITITAITCLCDPADSGESVVITVQERDGDGDSPAGVDGATTITCANTDTDDDGTLSNPSIDADDYMSIDIGTVTGTVAQVAIAVYYTIDAE